MLAFTHIFLAYSVAIFAGKNRESAVLFSVFPDLDILLNHVTPFIRNGVTHSIFTALIVAGLLQTATSDRNVVLGGIAGLGSHLLLDILSLERIMLFFPLKGFYSLSFFPAYGTWANLAVISASILLILESRNPTISAVLRRQNNFF